jgi:thiol-disulfide isomerase/thioredoxin
MFFLLEENDFKIQNGRQALYFYSTWMPFHKKMNSMISKIEQKYKDISFCAIDVDLFKSLTKRFSVTSIPTVIILVNGIEKKRITGIVMTSAFKSMFADICNTNME